MGIPAVPPPPPLPSVSLRLPRPSLRGMPDFSKWPGSSPSSSSAAAATAAAAERRRPSFKTCSPQKSHSPFLPSFLLCYSPLLRSLFSLCSVPSVRLSVAAAAAAARLAICFIACDDCGAQSRLTSEGAKSEERRRMTSLARVRKREE